MRRKLVSQLLMFLLLAGTSLHAAEQVWIPTKGIRLEATLYKPDGEGPFPLLIHSHGSTGRGQIAPTLTLRPDWLAEVVVPRGFALLAPMRRGRGASGGTYDEAYGCEWSQLEAGLQRAFEDMDAVLAYARGLPHVDTRRIVLSGQSRGGILSVAYGAKRPDAAVAVVNFVGGWHAEGCRTDFNVRTFAEAGAKAPPALWLYSENDSYYRPDAIHSYAAAFAGAGGRHELHLYPYRGSRDGHFFYRSQQDWKRDLVRFLEGIGAPPRP